MGLRVNSAIWMEKYNRWQIKVRKDGKRRTFTCPTPGRVGQRECQKKADAWMDEGIVNGNTKVSRLYDHWINELKISTSKSNWLKYEGFGRNYIKPQIGMKKMSSINSGMLQDVILYSFSHSKSGKILSAKTCKNIMDCLKAFIKYARRHKITSLYPEDLYIPNTAPKSNKETLQPDDLKILFSKKITIYHKKEIDEWFIHAYRYAVITGMRPGEIVGLENVDIDDKICTLHGAINYFGEETDGKNKNALRSYVIPQIAIDILDEQKQMLKKFGVISPFVFPALNGQAAKQITYYKHWVVYRDYNGISKRTPYEMRHTFFSANKALPKELLKAMGGHGKDFDTFGTYGHSMNGESQRIADMVNKTYIDILKKRG